jgi:hypothetical protein
MPKYLVEGRYTSDGLTGLAREGVSRRRADIAKMIESATATASNSLISISRRSRRAVSIFFV